MNEISRWSLGNDLEAPTRQSKELAEIRHYEVMTRIDTLCQAGKAAVEVVMDINRRIHEKRLYGDTASINELYALEDETFKAARSIIRRIGYE